MFYANADMAYSYSRTLQQVGDDSMDLLNAVLVLLREFCVLCFKRASY